MTYFKTHMLGLIGSNPEIIKISDDREICRFVVFHNYKSFDRDGKSQKKSQKVTAFVHIPSQVQFLSKHAKIGDHILLVGNIENRQAHPSHGSDSVTMELHVRLNRGEVALVK